MAFAAAPASDAPFALVLASAFSCAGAEGESSFGATATVLSGKALPMGAEEGRDVDGVKDFPEEN